MMRARRQSADAEGAREAGREAPERHGRADHDRGDEGGVERQRQRRAGGCAAPWEAWWREERIRSIQLA